MISIALSGVLATIILWKYFSKMNWKSPLEGIGRRRVLSMGLATWGGSIGRAFMARYTETFFIGFYLGPSAVAIYDLGFSSTLLVITFIPMALQTIFASGLAEAYVKDPDCLPRLVKSLYKVLTLLSLPVAAFGAFFAPSAVVLFYGREMAGAGWIASAFCVIHLLPLIAIPLSMAIGAKEKVKEFLPLLYIRVVVNVILDWVLISRFGIPGAIAAIILTFVLTFPLRLRYIRNFLGGFHFPVWFFLRFVIVCPLVAGGLWFFTPPESLLWLFVAAGVYFLLLALLFRFTPFIRHSDVAELRSLNFNKLNRLLDLLVGKQA
jgi:O-antigen/teichoic acid export membrane protein